MLLDLVFQFKQQTKHTCLTVGTSSPQTSYLPIDQAIQSRGNVLLHFQHHVKVKDHHRPRKNPMDHLWSIHQSMMILFPSSLQPMQSGRPRDDEWWKHRPIASIIQKSMCEQLFPGSLDRDHTETDDTMIDVISPLHAFCGDQGSLRWLGRI